MWLFAKGMPETACTCTRTAPCTGRTVVDSVTVTASTALRRQRQRATPSGSNPGSSSSRCYLMRVCLRQTCPSNTIVLVGARGVGADNDYFDSLSAAQLFSLSSESPKRLDPLTRLALGYILRTSTGTRVLQDLEEQKRTKYKINGTATTAIEKSNPNLQAKSRLPYSYQEHELVPYRYSYCQIPTGTRTVRRYEYCTVGIRPVPQ